MNLQIGSELDDWAVASCTYNTDGQYVTVESLQGTYRK